jgi:hypothetical protein
MRAITDLTGKRFSRLSVVRLISSTRVRGESSHTDTRWECLCDCGNTITTLTRHLNSGNTKSCGCLHHDGPWAKPESIETEVFNRYKFSAKRRGHEFEITKEEFLELVKQDCFYCGEPPKQIARKDSKYPLTYNGIDRIDNSKGYIKGNIVPCCGVCNKMKLEMSVDEFKDRMKRILNHLGDPT